MPRHFGLGHYRKSKLVPRPSIRRLIIVAGAILAVAVLANLSAHSRPIIVCNRLGCHSSVKHARRVVDAKGNRVFLESRPKGAPYAWCGYGLEHHLGLHDKRLWRAWAWARIFPRTSAHAGAIAVRRHHVMQLVRHVSGKRWLVRSYNDYRHKGWLLVRSVRGFIFVDASTKLARN